MYRNRLKEYREKIGISQIELSRRIKVAPQNLSNVERGRLAAWPRLKKLIAKALKTDVEVLFPEN